MTRRDYTVRVLENEVIMMTTPGNTVYAQAADVTDILQWMESSLIHPDFAYWGIRLVFRDGHKESFGFDTPEIMGAFLGEIIPFFLGGYRDADTTSS